MLSVSSLPVCNQLSFRLTHQPLPKSIYYPLKNLPINLPDCIILRIPVRHYVFVKQGTKKAISC